MRHLFTLFLLITFSAQSQDFEPSSMTFTYTIGSNTYTDSELDPNLNPQEKILTGFIWGHSNTFVDAFEVTSKQGNILDTDILSFQNITQSIVQPGMNGTAWYYPASIKCPHLTFEPGLQITDFDDFETIVDDPSNPVLGFGFVHGNASKTFFNDQDDGGKKHYRLALSSNSFSGTELVLSDIIPGDKLISIDVEAKQREDIEVETYYQSTNEWILSINLRRLEGSSTLTGSDPVLTIEMPYTGVSGSNTMNNSITFSRYYTDLSNTYMAESGYFGDRGLVIAEPDFNSTTHTSASYNTTSFTITKDMIPNWLDGNGEAVDVTLKVWYYTDLLEEDDHNPPYNAPKLTNLYITDQNLKVHYHDNLDIAIDWIRLSSNKAQFLMEGLLDKDIPANTVPGNQVGIYNAIQGHLNQYSKPEFTNSSGEQVYQPFRFYHQDTESSNPIWWGQLRYVNLLTNRMFVERDSPNYPEHYNHYTKTSNRFFATKFTDKEQQKAVPYSRIGMRGANVYKWGYYPKKFKLSSNGEVYDRADTLYSGYDTFLDQNVIQDLDAFSEISELLIDNPDEERNSYLEYLSGSDAVQSFLEQVIYSRIYINNSYKQLYSDVPWWMYYFVGGSYVKYIPDATKKDHLGVPLNQIQINYSSSYSTTHTISTLASSSITNDTLIHHDYLQVKTAEEIRTLVGLDFILGSKGFFFEREEDDDLMKKRYDNEGNFDGYYRFYGIGSSAFSNTPYQASSEKDRWDYILQEDLGGDYTEGGLTSHSQRPIGDVYNVYRYIDEKVVTDVMQQPKDKFYLGHKSSRKEIKKWISFFNSKSDELMNLSLEGWMAKGYKQWETWDEEEYGDLEFDEYGKISGTNYNPLWNYLADPPSSSITTINEWKIRPIDRVNSNAEEYYEPWDSVFIDVTLLSSSNTTTPSDQIVETFYIGIQNRRTDPLLHYEIPYDGSDPNAGKKKMKFLAGAEFDDLIENGCSSCSNTIEQTAEHWKDLWWDRLGAREITIPFNLDHNKLSLDDDSYYLIKVTQLGDDHFSGLAYDENGDINDGFLWASSTFRSYCDTIVGENRDITLKFLPGEAKILKCEVLKPAIGEGYLDNSNQSKFITAPVLDSNGDETDFIQFHLVYFKEDESLQNPKNAIYYSVSEPILKDNYNENIVWAIQDHQLDIDIDYSTGTKNDIDCSHPSIVAREFNNEIFVNVVYTCDDNYQAAYNEIVESRFTVSSTIHNSNSFNVQINDLESNALYENVNRAEYPLADSKVKWGVPVINASATYNFYAWTDSTNGIGIAYKSPDSDSFSSSSFIPVLSDVSNTYNSINPSLNVFSKIDQGQNDCALVWINQRNSAYPDYNVNILTYTRISIVNGSLTYSLPPNYLSGNTKKTFDYDRIFFIDQFNQRSSIISFPVVYRRVAPSSLGQFPVAYANIQDIISYNTSYNAGLYVNNMVRISNVFLGDSYNDQQNMWFEGNSNKLLFQSISPIKLNPTLGQRSSIEENGYKRYYSGIASLNYQKGSSIFHLPIWGSLIWGQVFLENFGNLNSRKLYDKIGVGYNNHQAMSKSENSFYESWKNRKAFESSTDTPPIIETSGDSFYKSSLDSNEFDPFVGYSSNTFGSYYINLIEQDGSNLSWSLPYEVFLDTLDTEVITISDDDSLKTDWFEVGSSSNLEFQAYGSISSSFTFGLEIQGSSTFIPLQLYNSNTEKAKLYKLTLINGQGQNYRFSLNRLDSSLKYSEMLVEGGFANTDTIQYKTQLDRQIIDLSKYLASYDSNNKFGLRLNPNPTADQLTIYPIFPTKENSYGSLVKITDMSGRKLFEKKVFTPNEFVVDVSGFDQGAYLVTIEENQDKTYSKIAPCTELLIIMK